MAKCKKDVTPLLTHWSYVFFALTHRNGSDLDKLIVPQYDTAYPKKYAHGFVVVVMQSFIMNSHEVFIHIHQGCFAGTGAIVRLPQCQWSKPDGYGKISQCITTTKHSKAKTVCIFLGIYCRLTCPMSADLLALRATIMTSLRQGRNRSVDTLIIEGWYGANFVVMCCTIGCRYDKPRCRQGTQAWCAVVVCHLCACVCSYVCEFYHAGAIKWEHFPLYWPSVRGIHWSPVNSPHKGQWRGALMFSLTCAWTNGSANNRLSKQSRRRWFKMPSPSLWRHCKFFSRNKISQNVITQKYIKRLHI